jgi:hypothetical protein
MEGSSFGHTAACAGVTVTIVDGSKVGVTVTVGVHGWGVEDGNGDIGMAVSGRVGMAIGVVTMGVVAVVVSVVGIDVTGTHPASKPRMTRRKRAGRRFIRTSYALKSTNLIITLSYA